MMTILSTKFYEITKKEKYVKLKRKTFLRDQRQAYKAQQDEPGHHHQLSKNRIQDFETKL